MAATLRRITLIGLVVVVLALLFPGQANAQPYEGQTLTCTPTTVQEGGSVTCTLTGCASGATAEFFFNGQPWASGVAASPVTVTQPVPPGTRPGPYQITADCGGGVLSTQVTVVASVSQPTPVQVSGPTTTSLPVTGSDSLSWVQIALVLIAVGGLLVVASRRRGTSTAGTG